MPPNTGQHVHGPVSGMPVKMVLDRQLRRQPRSGPSRQGEHHIGERAGQRRDPAGERSGQPQDLLAESGLHAA